MRNLSFIPAFGFQTDSVNSDRIYRGENVKTVKNRMWEVFRNFENEFPGAEIASTLAPGMEILVSQHMGKCSENYEKVVSSMRKASNLQKVLGYLPLIGMIVGISRLISAHQDKKRGTPNLIKAHHLVRGSIELLSLGFLLLIPDLILTACRERRAAQQLDATEVPLFFRKFSFQSIAKAYGNKIVKTVFFCFFRKSAWSPKFDKYAC